MIVGEGRMHVLRCWISDIYVHWWLSFLCGGYEGNFCLNHICCWRSSNMWALTVDIFCVRVESPTLSLLHWYVARSEISRACSSSAWACIADFPPRAACYNTLPTWGCLLYHIVGMSKFGRSIPSHAEGAFEHVTWLVQVFYRERLNGHYGVAAFVIGNTFSSLPFLFLISLISALICYFMVDLHPGWDHFAYFVLMLFACVACVESLMMVVASIVPNFLMGIITGAGIQVYIWLFLISEHQLCFLIL